MNESTPSLDAFRHPRWLVAALTIGTFLLLYSFYLDLFRQVAGEWEGYRRLAALAVLGYSPHFLVPLGLGALLFGPRKALGALGLDRSVLTGLAVGLVGTSLLPVGFALMTAFSPPDQPLLAVLRGAVLPGIFEEVLFRAFLFGFLFRFAGWGFLPAALASAAIFGAGHLHQGGGLADSAAIFAITALGAVWFAWLYVEWGYNIWVPAAFHVLMNMYWILFDISHTALGPLAANVLRFAVVLLSVIITVLAARRRGGRVVHGRAWLWNGPGTLGNKPQGQSAF